MIKNIFKVYKNKKILITGNTGFKGSWLSFYLDLVGANVYGISKNILTNPSLYNVLGLKKKVKTKFTDIKDLKKVKKIITKIKPDFIFHLAAQALVKKSYDKPIETFQSNTIGTLNILDCVKNLKNKCNIVIITSDKSYLNVEKKNGYKETDILGGIDPYSASKASAEIIISSYYKSFLKKKKNIRLVIARAGNVIGGGDWSSNRLIPDCVKSWIKNKPVIIRNPKSTRPWQHVFESIFAYLYVGYIISKSNNISGEAFNFGPSHKKNYSTKEVLNLLIQKWPTKAKFFFSKTKFNEAGLLKLNCDKAKKKINWRGILSIKKTIFLTVNWYISFYFKNKQIINLSKKQLNEYSIEFEKKILKK